MKRFAIFIFIALVLSFSRCKDNPTTPTKNPPVINTFSISPASINKGESATLSWNVTNSTSASIDQGVGSVAASGSRSMTPDKDTVYTLTASNNDGTITKSCEIKVLQPPKPGEWTASTAFGSLGFIVNNASTDITQIIFTFLAPHWRGIAGSVRISSIPPWAILNRIFKIETSFSPNYEKWTIEGTFDASGDKASGTWKVTISGQPESGSWTASPKS